MRHLFLFVLAILISSTTIFAQPPAGYYNSAEGKTGAQLKTALFGIIKNHSTVSYSGLWGAFKKSDKKANGKVWDMYSDCDFTFGSDQCGNYSSECDCYNREHSFPKSWFGNVSPMSSDMFHLYPTDGKVNGMRGNYPFGEVGTASYTSGNGCKRGNSSFSGYTGVVFEPIDEYKGDFARAYFYMATRYEDRIASWNSPMLDNSAYPAYTEWAVELLLKWHRQDPVSQKEIDRNNVIYNQYQHNRNPYVDHPEYADCVWENVCGAINFSSNPVLVVTENQEYTYNIEVYSPTGEAAAISCTTKPDWLTFTLDGENKAILKGTPNTSNIGNHPITLVATKDESTVKQEFNIEVVAISAVIEFTSTPVTEVNMNTNYSYIVQAGSSSGGKVSFSSPDDNPYWLTLTDNGDNTAELKGFATGLHVGEHNVKIIASSGSQTKEQAFKITVKVSDDAIEDVTSKIMRVYPNPVKNFLFVKNADKNSTFTIYDISGRMIKKQEFTNSQTIKIDVSNLESGVYILKNIDGRTVRFVKK